MKFFKCVWFLAGFLMLPPAVTAGVQMEITHYLPQVVSGDDWKSTIVVDNISTAGPVTVDLYDELGRPTALIAQVTVYSSDDGHIINQFSTGTSSISIDLSPYQFAEVLFDRKPGLTQGWAKVHSPSVINVFLTFDEYLGNSLVGSATVPSSPTRPVFSIIAGPGTVLALVNPNRDATNVSIIINNKTASSFKLEPGQHLAGFLNQPPFNLGDTKGVVVVVSDLPISPVGLSFTGQVFKVLLIGDPPRRVDMPVVKKKIGVVHFKRQDGKYNITNVAKKMNNFFNRFEKFINEEMSREGFNPVELNVDRDIDGPPMVKEIIASQPNCTYLLANCAGGVNTSKITAEILPQIPPDWSVCLILGEQFEINLQNDGTTIVAGFSNFGGTLSRSNLEGYAYVSAILTPFMDDSLFGDSSKYVGKLMPEFGNMPMPALPIALTLEELADGSLFTSSHELGHSVGLMFHTYTDNPKGQNYLSLVGGACSPCEFFRTNGQGNGVLLPIEAKILSIIPTTNKNAYGWIAEDLTPPFIQVATQEFIGNNLHVVFSTSDPESGISAIAIEGIRNVDTATTIRFYKEIDHTDHGLIDLLIPFSTNKLTDIYLWVFNTKGGYSTVRLF